MRDTLGLRKCLDTIDGTQALSISEQLRAYMRLRLRVKIFLVGLSYARNGGKFQMPWVPDS